MSRVLQRLLSLLLVTTAGAALAIEGADTQLTPPTRAGRISAIEGRMQQRLPGEQRWMESELNLPVGSDMEFVTDAGARAELQLGGLTVTLDGRTSLSVLDLNEGSTLLHVEEGALDVRIRNMQSSDVVTVETPDGTATLKEPGAYRIDASDRANPTRITSFNGRAEVETARGGVSVGSDEATEVNVDGRVRAVRAAATVLDDWAQQRENRARSGVSSRYVSIDVPGYDDMDRIGSWESNESYGPVWFPAKVGRDWAPYQDGKWLYVAPWGWTWIDAQSWGFAQFHYGRWVNVDGRWGWSPGKRLRHPAYVPAVVGFDGGDPSQFANKTNRPRRWVALAPGEIYRAPNSQDVAYLRQVNKGVVPTDVLADAAWDSEEMPVFANRERTRLDHVNLPPKVPEDLKNTTPGGHTQMVLRLPMSEARELGLVPPDAGQTLLPHEKSAPPPMPSLREEVDDRPPEQPMKLLKPTASVKRSWEGLHPELEDRSGLIDPVLEANAAPRPLVMREKLESTKPVENGCLPTPSKADKKTVQAPRTSAKAARPIEASMPVNAGARKQFEATRKLQPRDDDAVESQ